MPDDPCDDFSYLFPGFRPVFKLGCHRVLVEETGKEILVFSDEPEQERFVGHIFKIFGNQHP